MCSLFWRAFVVVVSQCHNSELPSLGHQFVTTVKLGEWMQGYMHIIDKSPCLTVTTDSDECDGKLRQIHAWERGPFYVQDTTNGVTAPVLYVYIDHSLQITYRHFPHLRPICTASQNMGKSWAQWKHVKELWEALFTLLRTCNHETRFFLQKEGEVRKI